MITIPAAWTLDAEVPRVTEPVARGSMYFYSEV